MQIQEVQTRLQRQWEDLTPAQRTGAALLGIIQVALLIAALVDIRQRSTAEIRGSKWLWTAIAFISYVGPIAYFLFGRKTPVPRP